MADDSGLTDIVRRAAQANAKFYKGWMDLSLDYARGLSEIFGGATQSLQSLAPIEEMDSGPSTLVLEGEAGDTVRGSFLVSNDLDRTVSCQFVGSDFRDSTGAAVSARAKFDPASIELAAGAQRAIQVAILIDDTLIPGVGYAGDISIGGMEGFAVPVVLRRQHTVDDTEGGADSADVDASSVRPNQPKPSRRKPAAKKKARKR